MAKRTMMTQAELDEDAKRKGWTTPGAAVAPIVAPSEMDRVDERGRSKSTGLPMGVEQTAKFNAADPLMQGERVPRGTMRSGAGSTFMPQGVESKARRIQAKSTMGPMPLPGTSSPAAAVAMPAGTPGSRGTMALPQPGAGTAGMPSLPGGGTRNANGDLTVEARAELDNRMRSTRADPMDMGLLTTRREAAMRGTMSGPARATTNPNARPVGRGSFDPDRIAEREYRQKRDPRLLMQRTAMREGQEFQRDMFAAGQAAIDGRQQQQFQREDQMFQRGLEVDANRDAREWNQSMTMFDLESQRRAGESDADYQRRLDLLREEAGLNSVVGMEAMEVPGTGGGYVPMARTQGGAVRPMGGYMPAPQQAAPDLTPQQAAEMGLEVTGWTNGRPQYGRRREQSTPLMTTDEMGNPKSVIEIPEGYEWDPQAKQLKPKPGAGPQLRTSGAGVFGNR